MGLSQGSFQMTLLCQETHAQHLQSPKCRKIVECRMKTAQLSTLSPVILSPGHKDQK